MAAVTIPLAFDGYTPDQRNDALLLDFLVLDDAGAPFAQRVEHPSTDLSSDDLLAAHAVLIAKGHARYDGIGDLELTEKGLAAHSAAQRALADLGAAIGA